MQTQAEIAKVDPTIVHHQDQRRLMQLVLALSREVEILREDNLQLRAAVGIYRELLKTTPARQMDRTKGAPSIARV